MSFNEEIAELEKFRAQSQIPKVQKALDELISKRKSEAEKQQKAVETELSSQQKHSTNGGGGGVRPLKKLTTYAFDESDKFVKLYYTVPGVTGVQAKAISSKFEENSFSVNCANVQGIDYEIRVRDLCQTIDASKCQVKQKSDDQLLVMLKKARESQHWGSLLKLDQAKEKGKMPKMEDNADPQESLMNMMKQMYDEGDDEMKRTIRKAWHEAQNKKGAGGDGGFAAGGGMGMGDF